MGRAPTQRTAKVLLTPQEPVKPLTPGRIGWTGLSRFAATATRPKTGRAQAAIQEGSFREAVPLIPAVSARKTRPQQEGDPSDQSAFRGRRRRDFGSPSPARWRRSDQRGHVPKDARPGGRSPDPKGRAAPPWRPKPEGHRRRRDATPSQGTWLPRRRPACRSEPSLAKRPPRKGSAARLPARFQGNDSAGEPTGPLSARRPLQGHRHFPKETSTPMTRLARWMASADPWRRASEEACRPPAASACSTSIPWPGTDPRKGGAQAAARRRVESLPSSPEVAPALPWAQPPTGFATASETRGPEGLPRPDRGHNPDTPACNSSIE